MDPSQQYEAYMMAPEGQVQAGGAEPQHNNLIINYIPSNLSEADVRNLFAPYGTVVHCKLVLDKITGTSAGYGFVKYVDDESAMKAITQLNGFQLHGKTLKVSLARPMHQKNEKTTLYVAGMPSAWSKADFEHILSQFGTVTESKLLLDSVGMSRGVGFITLDSVQGATAALSLNGTQPPGCEKPIQVKFAEHSISEGRRLNAQKSQMANMMFGMGMGGAMGMPGAMAGLGKPGMYGKVQGNRSMAGMKYSPYSRPEDFAASMTSMPSMNPMSYMGFGAPAMAGFGAPGADPYMSAMGAPAFYGGMDSMYAAQAAAAAGMPMGQMMGAPAPTGQLPGICLFIYHIPNNASEEQLGALFQPYGMVTGVKIIRDLTTGASKGFGFVNFAAMEQAVMAMNALQNYAWDGKRLRISFKTDKK